MDSRAELTLHLARLAHEHGCRRPFSLGTDWYVLPARSRLSWEATREALSKASKPVVALPLVEPGHLWMWSIDAGDAEARRRLEDHMANQVRGFAELLTKCGIDDEDPVELSAPGHEMTLTTAEFRQWTREYSVPVGLGVDRSASRGATLRVMPPGDGPPIGWQPPQR